MAKGVFILGGGLILEVIRYYIQCAIIWCHYTVFWTVILAMFNKFNIGTGVNVEIKK